MKILTLIENSEHCTESKSVVSCNICGEQMHSLKKPKTFQDHIMTIYGFSEWHRIKCIKNAEKTN